MKYLGRLKRNPTEAKRHQIVYLPPSKNSQEQDQQQQHCPWAVHLYSTCCHHPDPQKCHSSVQFSCSVVSDCLRPHESQHARPPCPLQTPRVYANSCPLSRWCHPAISSSVIPFSSCPQSLPASGSFTNESTLCMRWPKYCEFQLQHQSFQWTPRIYLLQDELVGSPCSPRDSQESSPTP